MSIELKLILVLFSMGAVFGLLWWGFIWEPRQMWKRAARKIHEYNAKTTGPWMPYPPYMPDEFRRLSMWDQECAKRAMTNTTPYY